MATRYQLTKTNIISADRQAKGTSPFATWVREHYAGKFLVAVNPIDVEGRAQHEPLRARGYEFGGDGQMERGMLVGKQAWFRVFDTIDEADNEIDMLTESGI